MKKRIALIINPLVLRDNKKCKFLERLIRHLRGHEIERLVFQSPKDLKSHLYTSRYDVICIAGGDGTLNWVINSLEDPGHIPISLIPLGTSNSFSKELNISLDPLKIAAVIKGDRIRMVDMGVAGGRRFILVLGVGFDAMVCQNMRKMANCRYRGYFRYVIPIIKAFRGYRAPELHISADGIKVKGGMAVVSNSRYYGWIFKVTDRARCDSGKLDICVFSAKSVWEFIIYSFFSSVGRFSTTKGVRYLQGEEISIDSKISCPFQMDGDFGGFVPVNAYVIPQGIPFLVP